MSKLSKIIIMFGAVMFLTCCNHLESPEILIGTENEVVQTDFPNQQGENMETNVGESTESSMEIISENSTKLAMTDEKSVLVGAEIGKNIKKKEMQVADNMETDSLSKNSNYTDLMVQEMAKEGNYDDSELGLYWSRGRIQSVCYTDVQELCEDAFGDYLSPLQGLTEMFSSTADQYRTRLRTDKGTAIVSEGKVQFYLFLPNNIAEVTISERDKTYYTEAEILNVEAAKGIKVLELPPTGGIGIAGTDHVPEKQNYKTHSITTKAIESEYTKADIQLVFSEYLQKLTDEIFGNYVQALQGLYTLAEQEGYGGYFTIQDMTIYMVSGHYDTTIIKENYCEFTIFLQYPNRARITISKTGDEYITTFCLLKEGEFETEVQPGG